jgi:hypothetical protein
VGGSASRPLEDVAVLPVWAKMWWKRDEPMRHQGAGDDIDGRLADMAERKKWQEVERPTGECNLSSRRCRCAAR